MRLFKIKANFQKKKNQKMKNMSNMQKIESKNIFLSLQTSTQCQEGNYSLLLLILWRIWIGKKIEHITHSWESIRFCKLLYCRQCSRWGEVIFTDVGRPSWSRIQDTVRYCCSQITRVSQLKRYWCRLM